MCQTYKIAICDDFAADRKYLSSLCERWSRHNCYRIQISEFTSAENFLFYYAEKKDFDILLLDIEMGAMDGVTMARKLRQDNQTIQIIFITGYADYISDGYEVDALHYLMKPIQEEKLFAVLDLVYNAMDEKGYNPVNQIVGYIMSGDPTYITSHKGARSMIMKVERDELVEELLNEYIKNKSWER